MTAVAVEFRGVGNTADFRFLARDHPGRVVRLDPLADHAAAPLTLEEHVNRILARIAATPDLVFGYCGTAALAAHIAQAAQARLVLVDPYPITDQDVYRDFTGLCDSLGVQPPEYADPPGAELRAWEEVLSSSRARLAQEYGDDDEAYELVDGLLDRYRSWLRFLIACSGARPARPRGVTVVVAGKPARSLSDLLSDTAATRIHHVAGEGDTLDLADTRMVLANELMDRGKAR